MTVEVLILLIQSILDLWLATLLILRRANDTLPLFFSYIVFSMISAATGFTLLTRFPSAYFECVIAAYLLDTVLCLLVIFELAGSVLAFNRQRRSRRLGALPIFVVASLLLWPLAHWSAPEHKDFLSRLFWEKAHAASMLELAAILALLGWSWLLKLRWPEGELRILSGLSIWPIVSFAVLIVHTNALLGDGYHWLDLLAPAGYIVATLYWIHYFWIVMPAASQTEITWNRLS